MSEIYSMTGFARADGEVCGRGVEVEVKSVNHRYLDLKIRLPRELAGLETKVAGICRALLARGHVEVSVTMSPGDAPVEVMVNRELAEGMVAALRQLKDELKLAGEPDLSLLASQKDVILIKPSGLSDEDAEPEISALVTSAIQSLKQMRAKEGALLTEDLLARITTIETGFRELEPLAKDVPIAYREKLERRLAELTAGGSAVEPERLAHEVAIFADRSDVTEELVRGISHVAQFRAALTGDGPRGRKLDFMTQEIFREINTVASKAQNPDMSALAVKIKTELEKIREQVQNLE